MEKLQEDIIRDTLRDKFEKVKQDQRVKEELKFLREFNVGDQVLFHRPGIHS